LIFCAWNSLVALVGCFDWPHGASTISIQPMLQDRRLRLPY
jgi:hypothetical protein